MANTKNLNIPLIDGSKPLLTRQFNDALAQIDTNALGKVHADSKAHWDMWQANTVYKKQDVFRTTTIPSWGFWEVTAPGTSGTMEPVGYGEGDTYTDGTASLVLRRLTLGGGGGSGTATDPSTATPWVTNTAYHVNKLVSYKESLYMCLVAHTSGVFKTDFANNYWKQIDSDQTVVGSSSGYSQITKLAVTATSTTPKEVSIAINETKSFCLPPVEVLKFKSGNTGIVVTECSFDNSDSSDFVYDANYVGFDGTMHPLTERKLNVSTPAALGTDGFVSISNELDITQYKSLGSITTVKE